MSCDKNGHPWNIRFEGGLAVLPADPHQIRPWDWTLSRLRELAPHEPGDSWGYDEDGMFTFGSSCFHAVFAHDLLQDWHHEEL